MPTFTIKGLPDALYRRLKERAAANRRSLNSEILVCLEQAVATVPIDAAAALPRIDALRARAGGLPLTDEWLRAARDTGRP